MEKDVESFKLACESYFSRLGLSTLRSYGRSLQLKNPTKLKKRVLIKEIIGVLGGEIFPHRSKLGAPIKNNYVDPDVIKEIGRLKKKYLGEEASVATPSPVEEEAREKQTEGEPVRLTLEVNVFALTNKQKQKLKQFMESL